MENPGASVSGLRQGPELSEAMSHPTACQRCRKQKLRCSRGATSCKRCDDIGSICTYPPPPDRKLLAAQRSLKSRLQKDIDRSKENDSTGPASSRSSPSSGAQQHKPEEYRCPSSTTGSPISTTSPAPVSQQAKLPSHKVSEFLIDALFNPFQTTTLLFHKPTFLSEFSTGRLPEHVLLSSYALGSVFALAAPNPGPNLPVGNMTWVELKMQAREWALSSSQAIVNCGEAKLEVIQSCQNLALYWISVGQVETTLMYTQIAYRTCRVLKLHIQSDLDGEVNTMCSEQQRRIVWACWITQCVAQDSAYFKLNSFKDCDGLPLPCSEESFLSGSPIVTQYFDGKGNVHTFENVDPKAQPSIFGEIVKTYGYWWEVQHFVKQYTDPNTYDFSKRVSKLLSLDRQLEIFHEDMPAEYQYTASNSFSKTKDPMSVWALHCLYHLSICALHSSVVPIFSSTPADPRLSKKFVRMCAEQAVKHSLILVDLANTFISMKADVTKLGSLHAYAFFVSSSIYFKSLGAQGKLRTHGVGRLHGGITILKTLKEIWQPLQTSWKSLEALFLCGRVDINKLSRSRTDPQDTTDFDQITSHQILPIDMSGDASFYSFVKDPFDQRGPLRARSAPYSNSSQSLPSNQTLGKLTLPIHSVSDIAQREDSTSSTREWRSQQSLQTRSHHTEMPVQHTTQSFCQPSVRSGSYQNYQHDHYTPDPAYRSFSQSNVGNSGGLTSGAAALIRELPPPMLQYSSGSMIATSYVSQQPNFPEWGSSFQMPMEGMVDGTDLWWEQSFDSMELDSYGHLVDKSSGNEAEEFYGPLGV